MWTMFDESVGGQKITTPKMLCLAMIKRHAVRVDTLGLYKILAVELEDGSGKCFNVMCRKVGTDETRTIFQRLG